MTNYKKIEKSEGVNEKSLFRMLLFSSVLRRVAQTFQFSAGKFLRFNSIYLIIC